MCWWQVEFSLLAVAHHPLQGSPHVLGELAVWQSAAPVHQQQAARSLSTETSVLSLPTSMGFNTQDMVQMKMSWGHNRFF